MNKNKILFSITCVLFLLLLTGCENMFFGVVVSSPVDVTDLPAKDKFDEIKSNPNNEKKIEELFKDKLWKTTVEIVKNYPINTYFKITNSAGNIAEFGTSNQLKTYNYKVTGNNWILLKNKTETVAMKYLQQYKEYLIVMLPGELFLMNSPNIGYEVKMEENNDKVKLENNPEIKPSTPPTPEVPGAPGGSEAEGGGGGASGGSDTSNAGSSSSSEPVGP